MSFSLNTQLLSMSKWSLELTTTLFLFRLDLDSTGSKMPQNGIGRAMEARMRLFKVFALPRILIENCVYNEKTSKMTAGWQWQCRVRYFKPVR